jgi:hypothetical protein
MPKPITSSKQLVVEGEDDIRFFTALLDTMGLASVEIRQLRGKSSFHQKISVFSETPEFSSVEALGIVRDADDSPTNAFKSVHDALEKAGLSAPNKCLEICQTEGSPRVSVMLMPSANEQGALEDLLLKAVEGCPEAECVAAYFECLGERGSPAERHASKRKVQVYIASHNGKDHIRLPGEAAACGIWPWDSSAFDEVKGFLTNLFG